MTINYRNEPFPTRVNAASAGLEREPAYVFSSAVHGDPSTPLFRAYPGDPVVFRLIGGAHEEGHNFTLSGHRWLHEPDDPNSNLYDSQFVMIAEFFNMEVSGTQVVKRGHEEPGSREGAGGRRRRTTAPPWCCRAVPEHPGTTCTAPSRSTTSGWACGASSGCPPSAWPTCSRCRPTRHRPTGAAGTEWPAVRPSGALTGAARHPQAVRRPGRRLGPTTSAWSRRRSPTTRRGDNDPNGVDVRAEQPARRHREAQARHGAQAAVHPGQRGRLPEHHADQPAAGRGHHPGAGRPDQPGREHRRHRSSRRSATRAADGTVRNGRALLADGQPRVDPPLRTGQVLRDQQLRAARSATTTTPPSHRDRPTPTSTTSTPRTSAWRTLPTTATCAPTGTTAPGAAWSSSPRVRRTSTRRTSPLCPSGEQAVIKYADATGATRSYREFVVDIQDGLNLYDKTGVQIPDTVRGDAPGALP